MIRGGEPWKNTQILFTLGLVFLCGAIAGAIVYRASSQPVKAVSWNDNNKEVTLNRLQKELQLTPDQTAQIETILDDFTMYYQMLQAQMDEVRANGKSGMEQVLNEEQRKKFGRIMHDFRDKQIR
ncbi:MAG: hypothetical protein NTV52_13370 [Acidobacteria bacterium]|nr:hypothetical protein [Acidobacteriota bacterium]